MNTFKNASATSFHMFLIANLFGPKFHTRTNENSVVVWRTEIFGVLPNQITFSRTKIPLTCSPHKLECWRETWAGDQKMIDLEWQSTLRDLLFKVTGDSLLMNDSWITKTGHISVKTEAMKLKQKPKCSTRAARDSWNGFEDLTWWKRTGTASNVMASLVTISHVNFLSDKGF